MHLSKSGDKSDFNQIKPISKALRKLVLQVAEIAHQFNLNVVLSLLRVQVMRNLTGLWSKASCLNIISVRGKGLAQLCEHRGVASASPWNPDCVAIWIEKGKINYVGQKDCSRRYEDFLLYSVGQGRSSLG